MSEEWLKNLKVGDKVFVKGVHGASVRTVQRITPTGRIVVDNTQYIDGKNKSNIWNILSLYEATEERIKHFYQRQFTNRVLDKVSSIKSITYEQAKQINEILKIGVQDENS